MPKKDLSYKYDKCSCGARKLKRSAACMSCFVAGNNKKQFGCGAPKAASVDGCCLVCKTQLKPKQKAFCGLKCRSIHLRTPKRQCECCNQLFRPKSVRVKYCTNECANKHKSELYRKPDSKMQQNKKTVNGCSIGDNCQLHYTQCKSCGGKRPTLKKKIYCSIKCSRDHRYLLDCQSGKRKRFRGLTVCQWCGSKRFNRVHANKSFCSAKCSSKHNKSQRRHRKRAGVYQRGINWQTAVKRFGWGCACCRIECVRPKGFNLPNEATLDHVHPIAKGGTHTWDNVQVLCRSCNTMKNDNKNFMYDFESMTK